MSGEPTRNWRSKLKWRVGILLVVLVIYVLSTGPAVSYRMQTGGTHEFLWILHYPIFQAARHAAIGKPLCVYLNLWLPTTWRVTYVADKGPYCTRNFSDEDIRRMDQDGVLDVKIYPLRKEN